MERERGPALVTLDVVIPALLWLSCVDRRLLGEVYYEELVVSEPDQARVCYR